MCLQTVLYERRIKREKIQTRLKAKRDLRALKKKEKALTHARTGSTIAPSGHASACAHTKTHKLLVAMPAVRCSGREAKAQEENQEEG
jgi:hypothetical protein